MRSVPAGLVEDQGDVLVLADGCRELVEEHLHRLGIGVRQHEREGIVGDGQSLDLFALRQHTGRTRGLTRFVTPKALRAPDLECQLLGGRGSCRATGVDSDATVKLITGAVGEMTNDPKVGGRRPCAGHVGAHRQGPQEEAHPAFWAPFVVVGEGAPGR